jgi:hypothetical protein
MKKSVFQNCDTNIAKISEIQAILKLEEKKLYQKMCRNLLSNITDDRIKKLLTKKSKTTGDLEWSTFDRSFLSAILHFSLNEYCVCFSGSYRLALYKKEIEEIGFKNTKKEMQKIAVQISQELSDFLEFKFCKFDHSFVIFYFELKVKNLKLKN